MSLSHFFLGNVTKNNFLFSQENFQTVLSAQNSAFTLSNLGSGNYPQFAVTNSFFGKNNISTTEPVATFAVGLSTIVLSVLPPLPGLCSSSCSGVGRCDQGTCKCPASYYGTSCELVCDKQQTCSGAGECSATGDCICDLGYNGTQCQHFIGNPTLVTNFIAKVLDHDSPMYYGRTIAGQAVFLSDSPFGFSFPNPNGNHWLAMNLGLNLPRSSLRPDASSTTHLLQFQNP